MNILIILIIIIIYYNSGIWSAFNAILLIANYIIITLLIETEGDKNILILMRILSIFMLIFIIIVNFKILILKYFL
jgi:hypothetical protein